MGPIQEEPIGDVLGSGGDSNFTMNWKLDPLYRDLIKFVSPHVEVMRGRVASIIPRLVLLSARVRIDK